MPEPPSPSAVALAHLAVADAQAVRTVIKDEMAVVIVLIPRYEPDAALLYRLEQVPNGWHVIGVGPLGFHWHSTSPNGERGVITVGVETSYDVATFDLHVNQQLHTIPIEAGYGVAIVPGSVPNSSFEVTGYRIADGRNIAGVLPTRNKSRGAADPRKLGAIGDVRHFLWATQRQIERYVASFHSIPQQITPDTVERQRQASLVFADAEFMLNAAAQTVKALIHLHGGPRLSNGVTQDIKHLRDLHEHWEQHKASFANPTLTKKKAGAGFAMRHPGESPWVFKYEASGHYISVFRIESLWDELELIDKELGRMNNAELGGTNTPHIAEDESRPVRPMPRPYC